MRKRRVWTAEEVHALGVRTTVPIAGEILAGLSQSQSYDVVAKGMFPVPVVKVGRHLVVPVAPILELLGIGTDEATADEVSTRRERRGSGECVA